MKWYCFVHYELASEPVEKYVEYLALLLQEGNKIQFYNWIIHLDWIDKFNRPKQMPWQFVISSQINFFFNFFKRWIILAIIKAYSLY